MGKDYGGVSLRDAKTHEQKEQRDTRDNVGVKHRDVVQRVDNGLLATLEIVDANGSYTTQDGRECSRHDGNDECILNRAQQ